MTNLSEPKYGGYTVENQIKNAIRWIDTLPNYKQPQKLEDRQEFGCKQTGFCCLGAGSEELKLPYKKETGATKVFRDAVGLGTMNGSFNSKNAKPFYGYTTLARINDRSRAGFKRISKLLRTHPEWMFTQKVANGIKEHYLTKGNYLYEKTSEKGYTHRAKFEAFVDTINQKDYDPYCFDIYTTNPDREAVYRFIKNKVANKVTRLKIIFWTTKECDDAASELIDEMVNDSNV